jgi:hypothetical protein
LSMVRLCLSQPCCSIFGMISCSLFPLTCQSHVYGPTSEHRKFTLPCPCGSRSSVSIILPPSFHANCLGGQDNTLITRAA